MATLVVALVPRARRHYAPLALAIALAALVFVALAQNSGEALEDRVDETALLEEHTDKGESVLPWAIATVIVSAAVTAAGVASRRWPRLDARTVTAALALAASAGAIGATWTVIDVGHSGAKSAWDDTPDEQQENETESNRA